MLQQIEQAEEALRVESVAREVDLRRALALVGTELVMVGVVERIVERSSAEIGAAEPYENEDGELLADFFGKANRGFDLFPAQVALGPGAQILRECIVALLLLLYEVALNGGDALVQLLQVRAVHAA